MFQKNNTLINSLITLIILLSICLPLHAESLMPEKVVEALIRGAHEENLGLISFTADLEKITEGRHAYNQESLIKFLRSIEPSEIIFQPLKGNPFEDKKLTVRITAPINMDFDLELRMATQIIQEDHYIVVGIHP